jgi:hypothetical protein
MSTRSKREIERDRAAPFEVLIKRLLVQEHPGITAVTVEPVLEPSHAVHCALHVGVPREHDERRVRAGLIQPSVRLVLDEV